jgi:fibronectin-binding autotransporter adhesin
MRTSTKLRHFLVLASSLLAFSSASYAQTLYWDANGEDSGTGGTGNWSDPGTWRSGSAEGTPGDWTDNSPAVFGGTGGTVTLTTGVTVNGMDFTAGGYTLTGNTLTLATSGIFANTGTTTISSLIAGSAGLNKTGAGTLTINGSNANTFTGGLAFRGGLLFLTYANFNDNNLVDSGNSLTFSSGGRLQVLGNSTAGAANVQNFNGTTLNSGFSTIKCDRGSTSAISLTVQLGTIVRNAGSVFHFDQNLGTSLSPANIIKTSGVSYNGVTYDLPSSGNSRFVGAGFTHSSGTSTRYVRIDSNGQFYQVANAITWVTSGSNANTIYNGGTTAQTLAASQSMYAILANNTNTQTATHTLGTESEAYTLTINGILHINSGVFTLQQGAVGGEVEIGAEKDLALIGVSTGGTTISAPIVDNSEGASSVTVDNRNSSGVTTLSANNTFTGGLYLTRGRLDLTGATQGTSAITFASGGNAVLGLDVTKTVTASSAAVNLANGKIRVIGTPTANSYTLLTANSITGTPELAVSVENYSLQVVGGTQLRLVNDNPSADPYEDWAGEGVLFGDDANVDGVSNGLAFLLGATSPSSADALGLLPKPTQNNGALSLSFQMRNTESRGTAALKLEYSNSLAPGSWTTVAVPETTPDPQASDVTFTITPGTPLNTVTATIASSQANNGKLFARCSASEN